MDKHDTKLIDVNDLPAALGLLTRLPVPVDVEKAMTRGAAAAWAYPVAGMVIGAILAATLTVLLWLGLPAGIAAALTLAIGIFVTGAMHEDGLADSADGLWGGWDRNRRLAIMKDSHIGTYGVLALGLSLLIRWLVLTALVTSGSYWVVLLGVGALSRAGMVILMGIMRNARGEGLSHGVGRPDAEIVWLAVGIAGVLGLFTLGLGALLVAIIAVAACGMIANSKIEGQTGDILGATQQIIEITVMVTVVAALD